MSERPVPRRESPWGMSDVDHKQPKPHRCNDRAEDVIQACFEGNPFKTVPGPFKLFWQCMRSKPGEEPTEPFSYLELDPPKREVKLESSTQFVAQRIQCRKKGINCSIESNRLLDGLKRDFS